MQLTQIVTIGDIGVGKTALINRFHDNVYREKIPPTFGVDFKTKECSIENESYKMQLWDFSGDISYRSMNKTFYSRANGIILVFDVTNNKSFSSLEERLIEIKQFILPETKLLICANKSDVDKKYWDVDIKTVNKFCLDNSIDLLETSAATGQNVTDLFYYFICKTESQISDISNRFFNVHNDNGTSINKDVT